MCGRLDQSLKVETFKKAMTGTSDLKIDPNTFCVSKSGQVQPSYFKEEDLAEQEQIEILEFYYELDFLERAALAQKVEDKYYNENQSKSG